MRFLTPDDYYVVRADVLEDDVPLYRVVNGKRQEIKGAKTKVSANQWHTLGIRAEADRFVVSFDGKSLFAAEDETFTRKRCAVDRSGQSNPLRLNLDNPARLTGKEE